MTKFFQEKGVLQKENSLKVRIFKAVLIFVYIFPVLLGAYTYFEIGTTPYVVVGTAILSFVVLIIPFAFLKQKLAFLAGLIFVVFSPFEIIHLVLYKESISSGFILLFIQTDLHEAFELFQFYQIYAIAYLLILIFYVYVVVRYIKNYYLFSKLMRKAMLLLLMFFIISLYLFSFKGAYKSSYSLPKNIEFANESFEKKFRKIYPLNTVMAYNSARKFYKEISGFNEAIDNFQFDAVKNDTLPEQEIYVLVIGETARYHNFSINGYHRDTNPLLSALDSLISYADVYSQSNSTAVSVPILLTRADALNLSPIAEEKTVLDAFQEVGFSGYWIANQFGGNPYIRSTTSRATQAFFTVKDFDSVENYDEDLWAYLDVVLAKDENKQFIVLHTLGSHFRYNVRYPERFSKFKPALEGLTDYSILGKDMKELLVNSYDNTILYTDYFLAQTIEKLKEKDAVSYLFYISDHGENLFDDNDYGFHGLPNPQPLEVHVPMIIWTSDKYRQAYPEKIKTIWHNKDKKLSSDLLFYSLLDMANIEIPNDDFDKSIVNEHLKEDSIRYVLNARKELTAFE